MSLWNTKSLAIVLGSLTFGLSAAVSAHEGHDHPEHGGVVSATTKHHFEVVFTKTGLTLYPFTEEHKPIAVDKLTAKVSFLVPGIKPTDAYALRPVPTTPGQPVQSLGLAIDLSKATPKETKVTFQISGLSSPAEPVATLTLPLTFAASGEIVITKATQADQAKIDAQKTCAVTKEPLGSMGIPLVATRGDKSLMLCCGGCVKTLTANPDKYFGPVASAPIVKDHR